MKNLEFSEIKYIDNLVRIKQIEIECKNYKLLRKIKKLSNSNIYCEKTIKEFSKIYEEMIENNNIELNECKNIREKLKLEMGI